MSSLVLRVAARHHASLRRHAVFLPDKLFQEYAARLKRIFSQELKGDALEHAIRLISDEVVPLHESFVKELI